MSIQLQKQLVQLDIKFNGPLVADSIVETIDDLLTLNTNFAYNHKMVWVREREAYFYIIDNGNGSLLSHWKELSTRLLLETYNPTTKYKQNDLVIYQNKIYQALSDTENKLPTDNKDVWYSLSGEILTYRLIFENKSEYKFITNIPNPIFRVVLGTIEKESGKPVMDKDGMVKITNRTEVEVDIVLDESTPYNDGYTYTLSFKENNEPVEKTGVVIIK